MIWYYALLPAALIAILVRLEAIFLLPYWSWLQLIPETGTANTLLKRKQKRRSLARRMAIPLVAALVLVSIWPSVYGVAESAIVATMGAGLLLWPLLIAPFHQEVRSPPWLAWVLYGLLPIGFAASGVVGVLVGQAIAQRGGWVDFISDQLISFVLSTIVVLFVGGAVDRVSDRLAQNREEEIRDADEIEEWLG